MILLTDSLVRAPSGKVSDRSVSCHSVSGAVSNPLYSPPTWVLLPTLGIINQYRYMDVLRGQRATFIADGLLSPHENFPASLTLITAFLLVLVGLLAGLNTMLRSGPFH